ncbi:MAG: flagellar biosynthetic protein FliR [Candidatus Schekmanbacteria bacterium]|nr:flagellar biosynthetic protein FliR [Candidatus Schekmanbacteria bacterium]
MKELAEILGGLDVVFVIKTWGLIMARVQPIIVLVPFIGGKSVPGRTKMSLAFILSIFIYPIAAPLDPSAFPPSTGEYVLLLLKEIFLGMTIGFIAAHLMHAIMMSGHLVDMARGASMASMQDPAFGTQASHLGILLFQLAIQLVFLTGAHRVFLSGFFTSFTMIGVTEYPTFGQGVGPALDLIVRLTANMWLVAIQLNLPAFILVFLTDAVVGILGRVAQQIKIDFVAAPTKMIVGVWAVMVGISLIVEQMEVILGMIPRWVDYYVRLIARGS